ncbi:MAG TPA: hypothetical protein VFQ38_23580 [Longimicrobiales bacterium]|nr:hypothetical protein [Longimicrobiales bacterium]
MAVASEAPRRRRWADLVVIVAGVYAIATTAWSPAEFFSGGTSHEVARETNWVFAAHVAGGGLALLGLAVAFRDTTVARVLVALGGLLYLSTLLTLVQFPLGAVLSIVVPSLMMLAAAPFVGPMPSPEEEGRRR